MAVTAILIFAQSVLGPADMHMAISFYVPNLAQIFSLATEIWPKNQVEDGGCHHIVF